MFTIYGHYASWVSIIALIFKFFLVPCFLISDCNGWKGVYLGNSTPRPEGKGFHTVCISDRWEGTLEERDLAYADE